jgi:hypothetical protein
MIDIANARLEIEERNQFRAEAHLSPLSFAKVLRRLYEVERKKQFEEIFQTSPLRRRIEEKLLTRLRRLRRDPLWKPTGFLSGGGLAFHSHTRRLMRRIWRMEKGRIGRKSQ